MSNITITNLDLGSVEYADAEFAHGQLLTFGGAGTVLAGTILAVDSSTKKYIPFVKGGSTAGNGIAKAVVVSDIVAAGAGDEVVSVLISGKVRQERLIIAADGDDSNIDVDVRDGLRDFGIIPVSVTDLSILDNS